jgi:hypothetical protein
MGRWSLLVLWMAMLVACEHPPELPQLPSWMMVEELPVVVEPPVEPSSARPPVQPNMLKCRCRPVPPPPQG